VLIEINAGAEADALETEHAARALRQGLLELDAVERVDLLPDPAPAGAKGESLNWTRMLVSIGSASASLSATLGRILEWVHRDRDRSVVVVLGDDRLEVKGISEADQKRLMDAFLHRHAVKGDRRG
jgi:hypothetical protein